MVFDLPFISLCFSLNCKAICTIFTSRCCFHFVRFDIQDCHHGSHFECLSKVCSGYSSRTKSDIETWRFHHRLQLTFITVLFLNLRSTIFKMAAHSGDFTLTIPSKSLKQSKIATMIYHLTQDSI